METWMPTALYPRHTGWTTFRPLGISFSKHRSMSWRRPVWFRALWVCRGIFVERQARARGIGKMLLDHVKGLHDTLWLHVYQQNRGAVAFYLREGFSIAAQGVDEDTGQPEYTMTWPASEN